MDAHGQTAKKLFNAHVSDIGLRFFGVEILLNILTKFTDGGDESSAVSAMCLSQRELPVAAAGPLILKLSVTFGATTISAMQRWARSPRTAGHWRSNSAIIVTPPTQTFAPLRPRTKRRGRLEYAKYKSWLGCVGAAL